MNDHKKNAPFFVDQEIIVLTRDGVWLSDGVEITHEPTRKLFSKNLKKDAKGYLLKIGLETKRIEVEDTAYFVLLIDGNPKSGFQLSLNDETRESLDPTTLKYRPGRLTCRIKHGIEEAKFLHPPYFDLLRFLEEDHQTYFLQFNDKKIELAKKQ